MNDNDNNDNTGNETGDNKVIAFGPSAEEIRARLEKANGSGKGSLDKKANTTAPQGQDVPPPPQEFEVQLEKLVDDKVVQQTLHYTGYVVATSTFIGFTDSTGLVIGVIPIDRVVYVRPVTVDEKITNTIA